MDVPPVTDPLTDLATQLFYMTPLQIDVYICGLTYRQMEDKENQEQPLEFSLKYPSEVYDKMRFCEDKIDVPDALFDHGIYMKTQENAFDRMLENCNTLIEMAFEMIEKLPDHCLECDEHFDIEKLRAEEEQVCLELQDEIRLTQEVLGGVCAQMDLLESEHFG